MLLKYLFPPEFSFLNMLEEQVTHAVKASALFKEFVGKGAIDAADLDRMRVIEHQADEAAHTIIDRLNRTFITPFDREDIYTLTKEMDDVVDMIFTITRRLHIYRLSPNDKNLAEFAQVIDESVKALACCVGGLCNRKDPKAALACCVEIHRLENAGDTMRDTFLCQLFETQKDAILVIKWKEVYQDAETVLDVCEDVANVIESILVKQA